MSGPSAGLVCRGLRKTFAGGVRALDGVDLDIAAGSFFTLHGPSGCGKTTLLRAIAGFEAPKAGAITLEGQLLDGLPPHRRPVNTVFQGYAVFPRLTVARNIAFALEMQHRPRVELDERVAEMLVLVRLEGYGLRMPGQAFGRPAAARCAGPCAGGAAAVAAAG